MQRARYDPGLGTLELDVVAQRDRAYVERVYYRFKSGYAVTGTYLKRIGRRDSD